MTVGGGGVVRWQMLQIAVAASSVVVVLGNDGTERPGWWALAAAGLILSILGFVMLRIGEGIKKNGDVLYKVGSAIGDTDIPKSPPNKESFSFWIANVLVVAGVVCLVLSVVVLTGA